MFLAKHKVWCKKLINWLSLIKLLKNEKNIYTFLKETKKTIDKYKNL